MNQTNEEATPIARLIGPDGNRTVGWVYAWENSELAILWVNVPDMAAFIHPKIHSEVLVKASGMTPEDVIALLDALPTADP